jgi:outer membrane receptor for ferrienterochelin and colicins
VSYTPHYTMPMNVPYRLCLLATAVLLLLLPEGAFAQQAGTISGTVRAAETNAPLAGVQVSIQGTQLGTISNQQGRFLIPNVAPGSYTVVFTFSGRQTYQATGVRVAAGETANVEAMMSFRAAELDQLVITASRREERAVNAPARVEVVSAEVIAQRPAVTPVEHLRNVPGVDIVTNGIQSTNVVVRGFNNAFSGALHALTDYRRAGVPSLAVNLLHLMPSTNEDIDRMEVVLGPGSALYGPNTANGVLHIITQSPLDRQGTAISLTGGERSLFQGSGRTAFLVNENLGVRVSGQYVRADDWAYRDTAEVLSRNLSPPTTPNRNRIGLRDESLERYSFEGRADWRILPNVTAVFQGGTTLVGSGIELTGIGASQIRDWRYSYYQTRVRSGRFFTQAYLNTSDAGQTYNLRSGQDVVDRSRLFVAQAQHGFEIGGRQNFTYGVDYARTMPETDGTIHGGFEDRDIYTELGGYLQSETALHPMLDLVLAGRIDQHSELPDLIFSPRAALVFKPLDNHSIRATYNRAFSTPSSVNLFLDIDIRPAPAPLGQLGYRLRAQGVPGSGHTFRRPDGSFVMRSPFNPAAAGGAGQILDATTGNAWMMAINFLQGSGNIDAQTAQLLRSLNPTTNDIALLGLFPGAPQNSIAPLGGITVADVQPLRESVTNSFEIGYTGIIANRLRIGADLWYAQRDNFTSPLLLAPTPLVFLNGQQVASFLIGRGLSPAQAGALAQGMAQVPVGIVTSPDANPSNS